MKTLAPVNCLSLSLMMAFNFAISANSLMMAFNFAISADSLLISKSRIALTNLTKYHYRCMLDLKFKVSSPGLELRSGFSCFRKSLGESTMHKIYDISR